MKRDKRSWLSPLLASLAALAPATALAQQPPAPQTPPAAGETPPARRPDDGRAENPEKGETVATTRFIESYTVGDWEKAEKYYRELVESWPIYGKDVGYVYKYAVVLSKIGTPTKKAEAVDQLQALLEHDRENIMAMYLLAQLKAQDDKPQSKEEAKDLLLNAARHGFYALREVMTSKDETFKYLRNDPRFILAAMKAVTEFTAVDMKGARNPFELPPRFVIPPDKDEAARDAPATPQKLAELEARVERIFAEIEAAAKDQKDQELIAKIAQLEEIMREYKRVGREKVAQKLAQWDKHLEEYREVRIAIKLQMFINEGNELLKGMVQAKQQERYEDVFESFARILKLVGDMQKEEREEFHRNADAIRVRGFAINEEAKKLKRIKELNLVITGIVLDPRPEGRNRAIIVFDDPDKRGRIYEENDELRSREDRRVNGLKIVKIGESSIQFTYEDTRFSRELKAP